MKRFFAVATVTTAAVLSVSLATSAVAQTTTTAGSTGSTGAPKAQGVTDTTVHVAYPDVDFKALEDVGVNIHRGDSTKIAAALAAGINSRGGVAGRKLQLDPVKFSPIAPAPVEASCVKMTEDLKVFAVVQSYPFADGNKCVLDHKTVFVSQDIAGVDMTSDSLPSPVVGLYPSQARTMGLYAKLLAKKGVFKGKTVGIVTDANQSDNTNKILVPALKKAGVRPKVVLTDDAPASDTAAPDANWKVFAEKLKAEGVNHLILVGGEVAAGAQRSHDNGLDLPMSSPSTDLVATLGKTVKTYPPSTFDGFTTVMATTDDERMKTPEGKQCIADFQKAYPDITVKVPSTVPSGEEDWATGILSLCSGLTTFALIADKAGKNLDNASFQAAANAMTQTFSTSVNPYNTLGPKKHDSGNGLRIAIFDSKLGPTGDLKPQGPLVNLG